MMMTTKARCTRTRTGIRVAIGLGAAIALLPFASGVAFAANADIQGGLNTFFVHVSGLTSNTDRCKVWLDNRPDPMVGSLAQPDPNGGSDWVANYDAMVVAPGAHTIHVTCTDKDGSTLLDQEKEITVGPQGTEAPPSASAEAQFSGTYTMTTNLETQTWRVTPCGPGCAHVEASGPSYIKSWSADALLVNSTWIITVDRPDAVLCLRQRAAGTAHYAIDATLTGGSVSIDVPAGNICNKPPGTTPTEGIALTKTG